MAQVEAQSMSVYAELISSTYKSFSIEDDIGAISRINESLLAARQLRQKRRLESRAVLADQSRTLESLRHQIDCTRNSITVDHSTTMNALDRDKFALAKGINDLETTTHSLEQSLRQVRAETDSLNLSVEQDRDAFGCEEATVLKLSVYRDLGISFKDDVSSSNATEEEFDGVGAGLESYRTAIVRTAGGKDVHLVSLENSTSGQYADHLWDLCSS